jgi:hypothetical protein
VTEFTLPEDVYDDLIDFIYSRESDIKLDIENFGTLKNVLEWIENWRDDEK